MKRAINILLIDDNPDDRALAVRELRREFPELFVREIADAKELNQALQAGGWDAVITDFQLLWSNGLAVLQTVKANCPDCPVLMFTGTGSEEVAVEAMKAGLDDYVLKSSTHYARLATALKLAIERAHQSRTLHEVEANYRSLFAVVPIGLYKTTPAGKILDANPAMVQMLGYGDPDALLSINAEDLYADVAERRRWRALMDREGVVRRFETRLRKQDGTLIWVEDNSRTVHDESGSVLYYEGSLEDITERLDLESKLLQAQKMESVGHLAAGIAHDFNNILTIIKGYADLLLTDQRLPQEMSESLERISSAADRAANVTRQLLTFSQRQAMCPRELDLNQAIQRAVAGLEAGWNKKGFIQLDLAADLPPILGDAAMIEQVVSNLVSNARDAMAGAAPPLLHTEFIEVDASCEERNPEARAGRFVCLSVSDTGAGMDAEVISRIFDPFFSTKEAGKGTGLGLATVYGITKLHQGWIEVSSQVGRGSTFKVFLPASGVTEETNQRLDPEERQQVSGGAETVLVVEGEPELRSLARRILEYYGYRVLEASSGATALKAWPRYAQYVDLLLTDVVMPEGVTGWEFAAKLREQKPDLKVICAKSYQAVAPGESPCPPRDLPCVQKPFKPLSLAMAVRACLDQPV